MTIIEMLLEHVLQISPLYCTLLEWEMTFQELQVFRTRYLATFAFLQEEWKIPNDHSKWE